MTAKFISLCSAQVTIMCCKLGSHWCSLFLVFPWTAATRGCSNSWIYERPARILFPQERPPLFQSCVKYSRSNVLNFCLPSLFHFTLKEEFSNNSINQYQAETIETFLWDFWLALVFAVSHHQVIVMKPYSKFLPKTGFRITNLIKLYANLYSSWDTLK